MPLATYLLTWNPKNWRWDDLENVIESLSSGKATSISWSCGNTRTIAIGARVFLLRQGVEPKGLVASGWVTRGPFEAPHYDTDRASVGDTAHFIEFAPDIVINCESSAPLDAREFPSTPLRDVNWSTPASGITIPEAAAIELSELWQLHTAHITSLGECAPELEAVEGKLRYRVVAHRSRERALRDAKIAQSIAASPDGRLRCEVPNCGFDFAQTYGALGSGYAQVHHINPLAEAPGPTQTRLQDLAVVCANCHAIIHRGGGCHPIESLISGAGDGI